MAIEVRFTMSFNKYFLDGIFDSFEALPHWISVTSCVSENLNQPKFVSSCSHCHAYARCLDGQCSCKEGYEGDGENCAPGKNKFRGYWKSPFSIRPMTFIFYLVGVSQNGNSSNVFRSNFLSLVQQFCHPNPCYNGGTCRQSTNQKRALSGGKPWWCECPSGYMGHDCQGLMIVIDNHNQLKGRHILPWISVFQIWIYAWWGYVKMGERAWTSEERQNACVLLPSVENTVKVCPWHDFYSFFGWFNVSYDFQFLEKNVCRGNPCKNGGLCKDIEGVPTCSCRPEYEGAFCERTCIQSYVRENPGCLYFCFKECNNFSDLKMPITLLGSKCSKCDRFASCVKGDCLCNDGYLGDGFKCRKSIPSKFAHSSSKLVKMKFLAEPECLLLFKNLA